MADLGKVILYDPVTDVNATINSAGELVVTSGDFLTILLAYDSSDNLEYVGKAVIGALTSAGLWQIKKLAYDGNTNLTSVKWADGDSSFDNVWDDRAGKSYS